MINMYVMMLFAFMLMISRPNLQPLAGRDGCLKPHDNNDDADNDIKQH